MLLFDLNPHDGQSQSQRDAHQADPKNGYPEVSEHLSKGGGRGTKIDVRDISNTYPKVSEYLPKGAGHDHQRWKSSVSPSAVTPHKDKIRRHSKSARVRGAQDNAHNATLRRKYARHQKQRLHKNLPKQQNNTKKQTRKNKK